MACGRDFFLRHLGDLCGRLAAGGFRKSFCVGCCCFGTQKGHRKKSSQLPILPVEHDNIPGDFNLMVANDLLRGSPDHYPIFWPDVSWIKFICVTPWKGKLDDNADSWNAV